ncbi:MULTISPECIES: DUF1707 domain-containing protein [Rhodococcus]|nr:MULTISPECIES: DUF1707 domain-containing protein [Rhodococcus]MDV7241987.1 DUF1707 domain-containing protein [Rhodococcus oxybenzonivorans]MDV7277749.1 DUF1707 domain-containing protein [Rhodococcus oxybenzonivorans]MDV7334269.1 DUF1707 domain-containing protein [Rhodococcus oxybenzonivorans]MDV7343688.1 DUF1707 domain-containing protein [Rhodococcus oxybenzonivorans]MDV8027533.1 DUF1707 domain-containing protein [Rhodococcus sp. IEGM 27]
MASGPSSRTRARDLDRVNACSQLDAAYADGQLDAGEYHDRTAQAMSAKTLAELNLLISDLQLPASLTDEVPVRSARPRRTVLRIAVGIAVAVAAGIVAVALTQHDGPEPAGGSVPVQVERPVGFPVQEPPVADAESPITGVVQPLTPDGIAAVFDAYQREFGDLTAHQMALYPGYALAKRTVAEAPGQADTYSFRGGFTPWGPRSGRSPGTADVDLRQVDVAALGALLGDAPRLVGAPDGSIAHVLIADGGRGPTMNIYVNGADNLGGGYVKAGLGGEVLQIVPAQ